MGYRIGLSRSADMHNENEKNIRNRLSPARNKREPNEQEINVNREEKQRIGNYYWRKKNRIRVYNEYTAQKK